MYDSYFSDSSEVTGKGHCLSNMIASRPSKYSTQTVTATAAITWQNYHVIKLATTRLEQVACKNDIPVPKVNTRLKRALNCVLKKGDITN